MEVSQKQEEIATKIVNSAYKIHKALGPGLLEKIYEACLSHDLIKQGFKVERQVMVPIVFDGITFDEGCRIDLLVEDQVIIELKASEEYSSLWEAQIISYMKLTNISLGFLINFKVPVIKQGIRRFRI